MGALFAWLRVWFDQQRWGGFMRWVQVDDESGCWMWTGGVSGKGYALFMGRRACEFAFYHEGGSSEFGSSLHHTCFRKLCVNPSHLVSIPVGEHLRIHAERWRRSGRGVGAVRGFPQGHGGAPDQ